MKGLGRILLFILAVVVVLAVLWLVLSRSVELTADLAGITSDVELWEARASQRHSVPEGEHLKMREQDGVSVNQNGRARLNMEGCVLEVYRSSELEVQTLPSQSADVCILQLGHGTIHNRVQKQMIVNTEWAVVSALSTEFLVHLDPRRGLLWVIVKDGLVEVRAAGERVEVGAGEQTWVRRGRPPEPPRSARRRDVGDLFPTLERLTNGDLADGYLLDPGEEPSTPEPLQLALEQSVDKVIAGECDGPHTVVILANLAGSTEALAEVERAVLRYRWEGVEEQSVKMERLDDASFVAEIGPFDYCCQQTTIVYTVEVFGRSRASLISESGKVLLEFCIA